MIDNQSSDPRRGPSDRRVTDRRQEPRHLSPARVRFLRAEASPEEALQGELLNASAGGIRLLLDEPLKPSEKLLVEIRDEEEHCFNLMAQVVWIETVEAGRYDVGCELQVELSRKQEQLLQQMAVADHLR